MDSRFLIRGLIIGFSIAAIVGPIGLLCIQRTLHGGFRYGLVTGVGAATADASYGSIAAFGLTVITNWLVSWQIWIHLLGGLFLIYLGIRTLLTHPAQQVVKTSATGFWGAYLSTFLLTLTNPTTILSFLAIFAGLGVGSSENNTLAALFVVIGVFLGSALWWLCLSGGISLVRRKFAPGWLLWINRLAGCVITIFGFSAMLSLFG